MTKEIKGATREKKDINKEIGKRLRYFRNQTGYSQSEIADKIGLSDGKTYSQYETGYAAVKLDKLLKLCDIYRVSPNTLLGYEDTARLNVLCDRFNITYEAIDGYNVKLTMPEFEADIGGLIVILTKSEYERLSKNLKNKCKPKEYIVPKHVFFEIMFEAERMVNSLQTDYLQKLRESEGSLFKIFVKGKIERFNVPPYTLEMLLHDLENIESDENDIIIEIDGKKISIDADVTADRYREEISKVIERKKLYLNDPNCKVEDKEITKEQIADLTNQTNLTDEDTYKEIFKNLNLTEEQKERFVKAYMKKLESKKAVIK